MREYLLTQSDFRRVRSMIYARAGIALGEAKQDMVYSRLVRRLRALELDSFGDYLDRLEGESGWDEWQEFTNALTTNLTAFFREPHHFDLLKRQYAARRSGTFRVWCSAASTGEEPYSLAIALCEAAKSLSPPVEIVASDIDTRVLDTASAGIYPIERVEKLDAARLKKFFRRGTGVHEGYCRVVEPLRKLIEFRQVNLLDARLDINGPFDAIFCRNVMIYFDKPTQQRVLEKFLPLLKAGGLLYAGHSESFLHAAHLFRSRGHTVYEPARQRVAEPA